MEFEKVEGFTIKRPFIKNRQEAVRSLMAESIFSHPELSLVCLGGSAFNGSDRTKSDIDITSVMKPKDPAKVDMQAIIDLSVQLSAFTWRINSATRQDDPWPVIISTIRLEEAQVALAQAEGFKNVLPIHWLHYPSVEFAAVNEPPELFIGLVESIPVYGQQKKVLKDFLGTPKEKFSHLGGLDWLTDSFRVFLTNNSIGKCRARLSRHFLKSLAMHNLEYFWKWRIIASTLEKNTGEKCRDWRQAQLLSNHIRKDLWDISQKVRDARHRVPDTSDEEIITLHRLTFDIWPI